MGKRATTFILVLGAIFAIFKFCNSKPEKTAVPEDRQEPLTIGQNSGPFNQTFTTLLSSYPTLPAPFVPTDTVKVNAAVNAAQKTAIIFRAV